MNARETLVMIGMCAVWGLHFSVMKIGVGELPPLFYGALRMTLVALLLAPFLRWRPGSMAAVGAAGLCLGGLNYAFMFNGVKLATASTAALAMELYVPFATLLSVLVLGERIGWRRVGAIALAFAGVAVIAVSGGEQAGGARIGLGVALVACGAMAEAVGAILIKRIVGFRPFELLAWFSVIGTATLWTLTMTVESDHATALREADRAVIIAAVLYSAVGASIIGHGSYYWLLQRLPISVIAPSTLLATVIAVCAGVALLGEPVTASLLAGGAMVLAGVGVVIVRSRKAPSSTTPVAEAEAA